MSDYESKLLPTLQPPKKAKLLDEVWQSLQADVLTLTDAQRNC